MSRAAFVHLLQHRADMIEHNVVCLPLCNSLGYLCSSNFASCYSEYKCPLWRCSAAASARVFTAPGWVPDSDMWLKA